MQYSKERPEMTMLGKLNKTALQIICTLAFVVSVQMSPAWAADLSNAQPPSDSMSAQLQTEITSLHDLLLGQPAAVPLSALFDIDLEDPQAVAQRIQSLQSSLAASSAEPTDKQNNEASTVLSLRRERDLLRLKLLQLPTDQRATLIQKEQLKQAELTLQEAQQSSAQALANAEEARDSALTSALQAVDTSNQLLASEEARLLTQLSELAALPQRWLSTQQEQLEQQKLFLERYLIVTTAQSLPSAQADSLYLQIREDLRLLRQQASTALSVLQSASAIPSPISLLPRSSDPLLANNPRIDQLLKLQMRIKTDIQALQVHEQDSRYLAAEQVMSSLASLQAKRVLLFPQLSPELRSTITGFNSGAVRRLLDEAAHVRLMLHWYPIERLHELRNLSALQQDVFTAGKAGFGMLELLLIVLLSIWGHRRSPDWVNHLRTQMLQQGLQTELSKQLDYLLQTLMAMVRELCFLATVYVLFDWLLLSLQTMPEIVLLRTLAYSYAFYALTLAFIHHGLLQAISRYRSVNSALNTKILSSLRSAARWVLTVNIYLTLAQTLLGRGALYGIAVNVAIFGAVIVSWRLIQAWREEITQSYLTLAPNGRLAAPLQTSHGKGRDLLLVISGFFHVAVIGLWIWLRDLALGFEQTRKALAYLFRRQLQAHHIENDHTLRPLPEALQQALSQEPVNESLSIDYFPELALVLEDATTLADGGSGALVAISGDRGTGKTTWLMALQRQLPSGLTSRYTSIDERIYSQEAVRDLLCQAAGIAPCDHLQQLIDAINNGPAQVIVLDLGQNLMLRAVGGLAGYETFVEVAQATAKRVLWVVAFASWPFVFLQRLNPHRDVFDRQISLSGWSERRIGKLIAKRMETAGYCADYDHLRLNSSTMLSAPHATDATVDRTADRYHRLIWDYADGNPRLALHFFSQSLSWTGAQRVRVRLFPMPAMNALEEYSKQTLYVLACLVLHENLSAREAAESLRFSLPACQRVLDLLLKQGILEHYNPGRYRLATHWNRAVLRFLQRKKLLVNWAES